MKRLLFAQMGRGTIQWGAFTSGKIQWGAFTITGLLDMKRLLFAQMGRGTIQWGAFTSGKIQWGAFTITGLLDMKRLLFAQMGRGKIQWGAFTVQLQQHGRAKLALLSVARRRRRSAKSTRTACPRRWVGSRGGCTMRGGRARPRCMSLGPKRFGPSDMSDWMLENTR